MTPSVIPPSRRHDIPWGDKQIQRFRFRSALLQRRGMTEDHAEAWADRLAARDADLDERRICCECTSWQRSRTCAKHHPTSPEQLARCHGFEFVTP
jgi:hypothetical protein